VPQGAVIPLGIETNLPVLQGRMHPGGAAAFLCGFQIYDSRTTTPWGLGRLRVSKEPIGTAIAAMSCSDGVVLTFGSPLDPASVNPEHVTAAAWNYLRSAAYGSGRYKLNGGEGTDALGVGQVALSEDRKSVFVHVPGLPKASQIEVRHEFKLIGGAPAEGVVYFTVHQPRELNLAKAGFPNLDLSKSVVVVRERAEEVASIDAGRKISESFGCVACHSIDGTTEGKTGPTWKGLFGKDVQFIDGSIESANEFYIRESLIRPEKKLVAGYQVGMPAYGGVLSENQIESIIMFIRSLAEPEKAKP
jgi:mono/diheme cytochrome c family protein